MFGMPNSPETRSANNRNRILGTIHGIFDAIANRLLLPASEISIPFSSTPSLGCPIALLYPAALWRDYRLRTKLRYLLARKWVPSEEQLVRAARETLLNDYFGTPDDLG